MPPADPSLALYRKGDFSGESLAKFGPGYKTGGILTSAAKGWPLRLETINSGNLAEIEWNDGYFKFCDFEGFSIDGGLVAADFVDCSFKGVNWYWGLFS